MKRVLIAVLLGASLAACGPSPQERQAEESPVIEAPAADTSIGFGGAGGITSAIPLTLEAVTEAAPNFIVAETEDQIEGQPYRLITLSLADEVVFRVLPAADGARVHSVTTRSTQARGPNNEIVAQVKFADAPATQVMFCLPEMVEGAAGFACTDAPHGSFWRVYKLPAGYDGPNEPFENIDPDAALDATLVEMRWIAPTANDD